MPKRHAPSLAGGLLLTAAAAARAAGGHLDVDDAVELEPGHCQFETWSTRSPEAATNQFHVGAGCRVGPVELGLNLDRLSTVHDGLSSLGPQLKWVAGRWGEQFSAGAVWAAAVDVTRGGRPAQTVYLPLTWAPTDAAAININAGADWDARGTRSRRIGVSGEWAAHARVGVVVERFQIGGEWTSRFGLRWNLSPVMSVDVSAARAGAGAGHVFAIGLNHEFAR